MILLVLLTMSIQGQIPSSLLLARDSSFRTSLAIMLAEGDAGIGSPALNRRFFDRMLWGGELKDWHTDQLLESMKEVSRAGFGASGRIHFYGMSDTLLGLSDWGMHTAVGTAWHAQAGFSRGLFEAIFKGNARHRGDTLVLDPFSGQYQSWQKFGFGLFHKKTFSSAMLSLVSGQDYRRLEVRDAGLYTSPLADSLSLHYAGEYTRSDTANRGWGAGNGIGLALDLEYNRPLATGDGFISVSLQDFGWVAWNKSTQHITFDSLTTWEGYSTEQLFGSDGLPAIEPVDSIHTTTRSGVRWQMLPFRVQVRMMKYIARSTLLDVGMTLQPGHYAVPMVQAGLSHFLSDRMLVTGRLGIGGYGTFSAGAECQWMPGGRWLIRAGTHNVAGWINEDARSMDAYFSLACFFNRNS